MRERNAWKHVEIAFTSNGNMCRMQTRDPLMPDVDIETFKGQLPSKARHRIPRNGFRFHARRTQTFLSPRRERAGPRLYKSLLLSDRIRPLVIGLCAKYSSKITVAVKILPTAGQSLNHMPARLKSIGRINRFDVQRIKTRLKHRAKFSESLSGFRFE